MKGIGECNGIEMKARLLLDELEMLRSPWPVQS